MTARCDISERFIRDIAKSYSWFHKPLTKPNISAEDVWFTKMIILCILLCNQSSVPPNTCYKTALNGKGITSMCLCKNMNRKFWNVLVLLTFTGLSPTLWPIGTRHLIVLLPHCPHKPVLLCRVQRHSIFLHLSWLQGTISPKITKFTAQSYHTL